MYEIKIDGKAALDGLERYANSLRDMTPLARSISTAFGSITDENFSAQGRPKWMGLKPSTIRQRSKEGSWPGMILQRSGGLASSIHSSYDSNSAVIGSNKVYAAIHQLGGEINKAAQSRLVRHRTDAKGNLLRTEHFKGKGLIFAKDSHKRAVSRWFEQSAHTVHIGARPYLPIDAQGNLQPEAEVSIMGLANDYLRSIGQ